MVYLGWLGGLTWVVDNVGLGGRVVVVDSKKN